MYELVHVEVLVGGSSEHAVHVEPAADEKKTANERGAAQRDEHGDDGSVAMSKQVCRLANDLLEEVDRLLGHQVVAVWAIGVGCVAVAASLG